MNPLEPVAAHCVRLPVLLAETTVIQALGTAAVLGIAAVAPAVAASLGVSASLIGTQVSLVYVGAMTSSALAGMLIGVTGPCRAGQIAMLTSGLGALLASGHALALVALGSLAIGLAYGIINPSASMLLSRHAPARRRNIVFSIKQTGVPIGGVMVGVVGPPIALAVGWSALMVLIAAVSVAVAAALEVNRNALDAAMPRNRTGAMTTLKGLGRIATHGPLACLSLASFCFSAIQLCLVAFLVVLLVDERDYSLVDAGIVLAGVQAMGIAGRLLWGLLADAVGSGLKVLTGLALVMALASTAVAHATPGGGSDALVIGPLLLLGLTGAGWNGVYLSEVARFAAPHDVGPMTGAAMFVTFAGVLLGPTLFTFAHGVLGSYAESYWLLAAIGVVGAMLVVATSVLMRHGPSAAPNETRTHH